MILDLWLGEQLWVCVLLWCRKVVGVVFMGVMEVLYNDVNVRNAGD